MATPKSPTRVGFDIMHPTAGVPCLAHLPLPRAEGLHSRCTDSPARQPFLPPPGRDFLFARRGSRWAQVGGGVSDLRAAEEWSPSPGDGLWGFQHKSCLPRSNRDGDDTWLITALNEGALDKQCLPPFESGGGH